jgi:hypothetical protein
MVWCVHVLFHVGDPDLVRSVTCCQIQISIQGMPVRIQI